MCIRDRVRGDTWPWLMACWKAHGQLSIHIKLNFFRYLLRFRSYEAECIQLSCFRRGSTSLHSNFTWKGSSPINRSWHQKTRHWATRRWRPHPSVFPRFDTMPECDARADLPWHIGLQRLQTKILLTKVSDRDRNIKVKICQVEIWINVHINVLST